MRNLGLVGMAAATMLYATGAVSAAEGGVVASIKPVHSLVAAIMQGVGTPGLIVDGAGSPHTYTMRPSQAGALEEADLVFLVGSDLEHFLERPLQALAADATVVKLEEAPGLVKLPPREGGAFEPDRDDHEGAEEHGTIDPHLWLDPENAKVMASAIEEALARADPDHARQYAANADALKARLDELVAETRKTLAPVKDKPFIVFHDAYHYFERRFGLHAAGSITFDPQVAPGVERLREIRAKIASLGAVCVFSEPQFEPKLMRVATEGTGAHTGTLDPLGADIANGPELYFTLIGNLAASLRDCLSQAG